MASGLNLEALQLLSPEQLATIPIMPAPPGQTTNFKDHPSLTPSVLIITGITVPLIFIFLGLRIYIRARINRDFTIDDRKSLKKPTRNEYFSNQNTTILYLIMLVRDN